MKSIYDIIKEGLFDIDDNVDRIDRAIAADWIEQHCTGDFKIKEKKSTLGPTIVGNLILDKYDGETIPVSIWSLKKGSLYITNCPRLKTIKGFFGDRPMSIDGGLYIENCPNLESLEGCPPIVDEFSLINCKRIKSLVGAPEHVFGNCYIMKNGKKFKEDEIKAAIQTHARIDCNEEEIEANLNEAFTEPHLLKLSQHLKDNGTSFKQLIASRREIAFDKITSKDVKTYPFGNDEAIKACNKIISGKTSGFIILLNSKGEYTDMIFGKTMVNLIPGYNFGRKSVDCPSREILDDCKRAGERVVFYTTIDFNTSKIKLDRRESREGMITNTPEQNETIAKENMRRYKKLAAQMRANKDNDFEKLDDAVEDIIMRVVKACRMAHRDPNKFSKYTISALNLMVYDQTRYSNGKSYGQDGLLVVYDRYTDCMTSVKQGTAYAYEVDNLPKYKKAIEDRVAEIDKKLKELGV